MTTWDARSKLQRSSSPKEERRSNWTGIRGLCWVLALLLAGQSLVAQEAPTTESYDIGGVRVLHRNVPGAEVIAVRLYLLGGVQAINPGEEGKEALLLRTIARDVNDDLESAGGRPTVGTSRDWSVFGFVTMPEYLDDVWAVWAGALIDPDPSDPSFRMVQQTMVSQARGRAANPLARSSDIAWFNAFEGHPYVRDPWGTPTSLQRVQRDDLIAHAAETLVTSRMLLVVVGDISRHAVSEMVRSSLATLAPGSFAESALPPVEQRENSWKIEPKTLPTSYIHGYIVGPKPTDEDYFPFEVASNLLSSRLFSVLRNERSLSYAASATFQEGAIPVTSLHVSSRNPGLAYKLMLDQVAWLQEVSDIPKYVLNRYLDQFILGQIANNLTVDNQAHALAAAELYWGDFSKADRYIDEIRRVTPREIRRVGIYYMRNMQLAFLGNPSLMEGKW